MPRLSVRSSVFVLAIVLATVLAGACRGATEPHVVGAFALESIAGEPLPAAPAYVSKCLSRVVADTLVLRADGRGSRRYVQESPYAPGVAVDPDCTPTSAEWLRSGDTRDLMWLTREGRVEITFICGPAELCTAGPHMVGTVGAGGASIAVPGERGAMLYRSVASSRLP